MIQISWWYLLRSLLWMKNINTISWAARLVATWCKLMPVETLLLVGHLLLTGPLYWMDHMCWLNNSYYKWLDRKCWLDHQCCLDCLLDRMCDRQLVLFESLLGHIGLIPIASTCWISFVGWTVVFLLLLLIFIHV